MDKIWEFLDGATPASMYTPETVLLSLLLAFVLGQVVAWVYYFTHSGLSYSKSFVQSLILITVVISMVMSTIAGSFVTAVGLMGALSIIRFRNMIKDTRDIAFIFCSLVIGMAAGSQRYMIAILGTIVLSGVILYLYLTDFGKHKPHNGFLRFSLTGHIGPKHPIPNVLRRFCRSFTLISAQDGDFGTPDVEYSYQVMIRNASRNEQMLAELQNIQGVKNVSLTMQEQLLEV
ncbi:MAG TPA: DUF4956 domain-containing protein [Anaerohalosphaeraceae bacterium]|jgi:uncharacterized membrane protein YhiD involved in acid resistance|nr:DUF4956 domain-containing protein [Anaerohalosphaeraceae bacterium]HRT51909.1 DUF4956 domain-containing protein [Anaerohalosphaeraceae bacterium]HRT87696.1 DUF4956 domain-containing protein [Anaerohalosphaeraceae bacterium]